jgi:sirohydrochlorin ferrochelatase
VLGAFLDVVRPSLAEVVCADAVVVPLLLAGGFHVRADIPAVLAAHPSVTAAAPIGPDPLLSIALADRLATARGTRPLGDVVALVAAGSSDPAAHADLRNAAADLANHLDRPVELAVLGGAGQRLADIRATHPSATIDVAAYLLAPGFFYDRLTAAAAEVGAEVVAAPIGAHARVIDLVWRRFDETSALAPAGSR